MSHSPLFLPSILKPTFSSIRLNRFLAGFPPFSGATSEETWSNLKNWSRVLRRPHYDREEDRMFNLTDIGWSAVTSYVSPVISLSSAFPSLLIPDSISCPSSSRFHRLITTKERRLSTFEDVKSHPFFRDVDWDRLRSCKAPFIPALDSEVE